MSFTDDISEVLISTEAIRARVAELGAQISADYSGKNPILACVLKGGLTFLADLSRAIPIPHEIDFLAIGSYGPSTTKSGVVRILMDLESSIQDRHVLLVEDIVNTGRTLAYIVENLQTRRPASLRICTLLDKPDRHAIPIHLDYVGFTIPDRFVVGYGLDYQEKYRNLPYVGVLHGTPNIKRQT